MSDEQIWLSIYYQQMPKHASRVVIKQTPTPEYSLSQNGILQGHVKLHGLHDTLLTGTRSSCNKCPHVRCHQSEDVRAWSHSSH